MDVRGRGGLNQAVAADGNCDERGTMVVDVEYHGGLGGMGCKNAMVDSVKGCL